MEFWIESTQLEELQDIVDSYWFLHDTPKELLILPPEISNDIIFNLSPPTKFIFKEKEFNMNHHHISGIRTHFYHVNQYGKIKILGIRFKPWVFSLFFGLNPILTKNQFLPLNESHALSIFDELPDYIKNYKANDNIIELIDTFLMTTINFDLYKLHIIKKLFSMLQLSHETSVVQLAEKSNLSISTIERVFKSTIGALPKQVSRIMRYNKIWSEINNPANKSWADILYTNNYYDQSHFIKEFAEYTGITPEEYMENRNSIADKYKTI